MLRAHHKRPRALVLVGLTALLLGAPALFAGGAAARSSESPHNSGPPTITGTADVGQTLTGNNGSWLYGDGTACGSECTYTFQWQRCDAAGASCQNIAGATSQTYVVAPADAGSKLRVVVTATKYDCDFRGIDCRWVSVSANSGTTALVPGVPPAPPEPPVANALPTIVGLPQVGQTLTAVLGEWRGTAPVAYAVQWSRCPAAQPASTACSAIAGATGQPYLAAAGDVGSVLQVTVTATNQYGSATAVSPPTAVVAAIPSVAPTLMVAPTIFGLPREGQTLTATAGAWAGTPTMSYGFQWQRCARSGTTCVEIAGATSSSYTAVARDGGERLLVVVTVTNPAGTLSAASQPTAPVEPKGLIYLETGQESVPAASVSAPARLRLDGAAFRSARGGSILRATFHVSDTRGYVVRGALVSLRSARPGDVAPAGPVATGDGGSVTLIVRVSPAKLRRGGPLVLRVQATRRGSGAGAVAAHAVVRLLPRTR